MRRSIAASLAIGVIATLTAELAGSPATAAGAAEPPDPPADLRVTDLQPEAMTIAWDKTPRAESYSVVLIALEVWCGTYYRHFTTTELTATFEDLNWDCPYRVGVRSYVPSNYPHPYSELTTIEVTTPFPEGYEPPGPPSNLRAERDANGKILRVVWDPATEGFGLLVYQPYVDVEGYPELSGRLGSFTAQTFRDVERDFADFGSILEPGQTVTVWVTTADQTRDESPPSEKLVLTCCPL